MREQGCPLLHGHTPCTSVVRSSDGSKDRTILRPTSPRSCFDFTLIHFYFVFCFFHLSFVSSIFCHFSVIHLFFSILLLGYSLFPILSLFFHYFLYLLLSTLLTTYESYLQIVLCFSCLCSFADQPILRRILILSALPYTTLFLNCFIQFDNKFKQNALDLHLHLYYVFF